MASKTRSDDTPAPAVSTHGPTGPSVLPTESESEKNFVFDPFAAELIDDPYPSYRVLRERLPVHHNPDRGLWFLSRFEDVRAAARDHESFSSSAGIDIDDTGPQFGEGVLVEIDPPKHDDLRRLLKADFTPKAVARLDGEIRAYVARYISSLVQAGGGDVVEELTWKLPIDVMADLLGVPDTDRPQLGRLLMEFLERVPGQSRIPESALAAGAELRGYFADLVRKRRRNLDDGFTSRLIRAEGPEGITPEETDGICFFFFTAGTDSPSDLISTALFLLAVHADQRECLVRDRSLTPSAVEEVLRYEAPLQNYARLLTHDVEFRGQSIPGGERIVLVAAAANRDERRFENPDSFDVARELKRHLSFGEGIHFCLGGPLARLQARAVLDAVLTEMPEYELSGPAVRATKQNNRGFRRLDIELVRPKS